MIKTIELKNITSNPFNARLDYAQEPINELAQEIKRAGFWVGALRGRMKNGKVELCFGHRRYLALKKLGWKEAQVEIVELSDEEMAMQGLAENLQRQGLNDMEKAEGIKKLVQQLTTKGEKKESAYDTVAVMFGVTEQWIKELIGITEYESTTKQLIAERKIAGRTAMEAHHLGGAAMIKTAAREHIPLHTITKLSQVLKKIPDASIKERLKKKVVAGEILDPKVLEKKAEPMLHAKAEKGKPPPDLMLVIARWTSSIKEWRKALREVIPYRGYFSKTPKIAAEFTEQVRGLIKELEQFLPDEIE